MRRGLIRRLLHPLAFPGEWGEPGKDFCNRALVRQVVTLLLHPLLEVKGYAWGATRQARKLSYVCSLWRSRSSSTGAPTRRSGGSAAFCRQRL